MMNFYQDDTEFGRLLADSSSSTLQGVLGETAAEALLFHLGAPGSSMDPEGLASGLERVLGEGAVVIEKLILKDLSKRMGTATDGARQEDFATSVARIRGVSTKDREHA